MSVAVRNPFALLDEGGFTPSNLASAPDAPATPAPSTRGNQRGRAVRSGLSYGSIAWHDYPDTMTAKEPPVGTDDTKRRFDGERREVPGRGLGGPRGGRNKNPLNAATNDMLPRFILDQFTRIPHNTPTNNDYYGVFNNILTKVCFPDNAFTVHPYYLVPPTSIDGPTIDFVVTHVGEAQNPPIFFLEIKPPLYLDHIYSRVDADAQMRARFLALYEDTPTPRLHGVSAMGQRLAFYCLDKTTTLINPHYVAPSTKYIIDTIPAERWDKDITTEEGYKRLMAVIDDVKQMAAAL